MAEKMFKRAEPSDFVGVTTPTLIYIGVKKLEDFNKIAAAPQECVGDSGNVIVKEVTDGKVTVIFQYWLIERDHVAEANEARMKEAI